MTATAFVEEGHALTFACNILRMRPDELTDPRGLPDHLRQILMREIKTLTVAIQHRGQEKRKFRVIGLSRLGADQLTFPDPATGGEQTTVAAYFERTYAKLRYPHLPCLHVGSSKKHVYLPMEVCKMVAQRRTKKLGERMMGVMNAKTCTRPGERARHIHERAMAANYTGDVFLREFKIACMPELVAVQGRVLPAPLIQYRDHSEVGRNTGQVKPHCGQWTLRDTQLHTPATLSSWAVINTTRAREDQVGARIENVERVGQSQSCMSFVCCVSRTRWRASLSRWCRACGH